ncbi:MAG: NPCBM/NEW2 domain-containing protein [Saprospiraceae bacterium]|nr:NPCBM/NEW2 domain-containing protein [Saprospiraceae bacterium]
MVRTSNRQPALARQIKSRYGYLFVAIICFLGLSFQFIYSPPPGINQPTSVAPYLDGNFPDAAPSGTNQNWTVENAFPHLTFIDPVALIEIPSEDSYYVASKVGVIWKISNDSASTVKDNVLDISDSVDTDFDAGLLNAIIHPEFGMPGSTNRGYIYLYYRWHPNGNIIGCENPSFLRLSRFHRPDGQEDFDPNSEFVLIQTYDDHCWHNGGAMFFDNAGYFYYTAGDAGGINDPYNTTQQIDNRLMSGLFRIDLEMDANRSHAIRRQQIDPSNSPFLNDASFSQGYFIPNDNPWLNVNGSVLEEYYALGLRSPHRAMIDTVTGEIWIGDVGQGSREEISIVDQPGLNLQWPYREGSIQGNSSPPAPVHGRSTPPVYDYTHADGNSIIGGFVYHGMKYQGELDGKYIFGDHGVRNIWSYNPTNGEVIFLTNVPATGIGDKNGISSFATNVAGDIFVLKLFGTALDGGIIYRLKEDGSVPEPPQFLSETGAFSSLNPLTPDTTLVPYEVNAPLWSDRAIKQRWIAIPNDGTHDSPQEQITFSANSTWQFPSGTVMVKHFALPIDYENPSVTVPIETRFFIITSEGAYGVTYKWNDQGTDAELLVNSQSKNYQVSLPGGTMGVQTWNFPSRSDCMTCHTANADFVLGIKTWQLNADYTYPSMQTDNQLNTWRHLGIFGNAFEPEDISTFLQAADISDTLATLETRVRSYLDSNCAHCHQPNGVASAFDARFSTPLPSQNIIWSGGISPNTPTDHYMVKPRDLDESEIWVRDKSLSTGAMPPLAKNLVDTAYISILEQWINSLNTESCSEMPVSDQTWLSAINGQGPVEINRSVGSEQPNDGQTIKINGRTFSSGLGVHAHSEITYATNGDYALFQSYVGVDDECNSGSVKFEVYKGRHACLSESTHYRGG